MGSTTTTTVSLWEGVGVEDTRVLGLPFGLAGPVCGTASGEGRDVIEGMVRATIYCIISISLKFGLGILTLNWIVLGASHCVMLLIHVSFQKQAALRYFGALLQ
jgi:hypothetical protein